eukprot:6345071-Alexandrium_andersonii.AAC.1
MTTTATTTTGPTTTAVRTTTAPPMPTPKTLPPPMATTAALIYSMPSPTSCASASSSYLRTPGIPTYFYRAPTTTLDLVSARGRGAKRLL